MNKIHALLCFFILAACKGGSTAPAAAGSDMDKALAQAVLSEAPKPIRGPIGLTGTSPLWDSPERLQALPLASGNGTTTTASSVTQLLAGNNGIYFGGREAHEDWPALVKRYANERDVSNWVRGGEMARVDAWMAKKFERADRIGGWPLAYVNASTGAAIEWKPDNPEPPDEAPAIATDDTRSVKRGWVAISRDYNIVQALSAARIFRTTGERRYADWAAEQLDFYAAHYAAGPVRTREGRSTYYSQGLDEAVAVFKLLDTARLLKESVDPARYAAWRDKLFMPMAANLKFTSAPMSNIQLWHQMARAAIAMRFGDSALLDEAQLGPQGIDAVMAACLTADNFWIEGTFSYNAYVLEGIAMLLTSAGVEGYGARFAGLRDQAVRMLLVTLDYRFDDDTLPNPNDSRGVQVVIPQPTHWQLFRTAPTYWGLAKANAWRTWESLLDPPRSVPSSAPQLPTAQTRNFPAVRQAVLRAGDWQAYIHYGAAISNHVQTELTTFELHEGKSVIARDPGTVDYASPYHKDYFQTGTGNNVPLIDGLGQSGWAPGQLGAFDAAQDRLVISHPTYQPDASVTRGYRLTTQGFVERTGITVPSGTPRRLGVVFNTGCSVSLGSGTTPSATMEPPPNVTAMQTYWSGVNMARGAAQWQAKLTCNGKHYLLTVAGPDDMRIYTASAPDTPLPNRRQAIYYEVTAAQANFEASFTSLP